MRCPFCSDMETKVIDSRLANDGDMVRRRRECLACSERFTTYESAELVMPRIVKRDGSRVPFDEEKLRSGFRKAIEKRPVGTEEVENAIINIKRRLRATGDREVSSELLGGLVMDELRELDDVAYVRFASVYRSFQDVQAFREEIDRLEKQLSNEDKRQQIPLLPESKPVQKRQRRRD